MAERLATRDQDFPGANMALAITGLQLATVVGSRSARRARKASAPIACQSSLALSRRRQVLRDGGKALHQRAQVEAGTATQDGQAAPAAALGDFRSASARQRAATRSR